MSHVHYQVRNGVQFTTLRGGRTWRCPSCGKQVNVKPCVLCLAEREKRAGGVRLETGGKRP